MLQRLANLCASFPLVPVILSIAPFQCPPTTLTSAFSCGLDEPFCRILSPLCLAYLVPAYLVKDRPFPCFRLPLGQPFLVSGSTQAVPLLQCFQAVFQVLALPLP